MNDSLAGGQSIASKLNSLVEAEDVVRKMEFKYRIKAAELDAVMSTLSRMATGENDTLASRDPDQSMDNTTYSFDALEMSLRPPPLGGDRFGGAPRSNHPASRSSRDAGVATQNDDFGVLNNEHFDSVTRDMQTELYEARIITADKEIEALHRNLQKERSINATLKAQIEELEARCEETSNTGAGASAGARGSSRARSVPRGGHALAGIALRPPKASEEPLLPFAAAASAVTSGVSSNNKPGARMPTRRGSTGSVDRSTLMSLNIPPFSNTGTSASTGGGDGFQASSIRNDSNNDVATTAGPPSESGPVKTTANTDPLLDFTKEYVIPELKSKI